MAAFHGALNANKRFIPGQLERLYQSIIIMAMAIFFSARLGVNALVVGFCLYIAQHRHYRCSGPAVFLAQRNQSSAQSRISILC